MTFPKYMKDIKEPGIYVDSEGDLLFVRYDNRSNLEGAWISLNGIKEKDLWFFSIIPERDQPIIVTLEFKLGPLGKYLYL